jgi:hypothetical protein
MITEEDCDYRTIACEACKAPHLVEIILSTSCRKVNRVTKQGKHVFRFCRNKCASGRQWSRGWLAQHMSDRMSTRRVPDWTAQKIDTIVYDI